MNDYAPSIKYIHNFVFDLLYVRCCFVFGRKIQLLFCGFWSLVIESSSALWQVREFWNFQRQGRKQSYTLNIVFFLKMLWFFWTLPVLLQRWCSTCLVCVHTLTLRETEKGQSPEYFKSSKKNNFNKHPVLVYPFETWRSSVNVTMLYVRHSVTLTVSTILSPKCSPFCPYHSVTLTVHHYDIWLSTILLPDHIFQSDKLTVHNSVTLHFIMSIILSPYCPWFCHLTVLHSVTLIVHHSVTPTNL